MPSLIVEVDTIPRDKNGAVATTLLPSPYTASTVVEGRVPSSDMERALGAIWAELLDVDRVAASDNFFSLGGYSLLCFKVIERLRVDTGAVIGPRILLLGTLEQAAAEAEQNLKA
jgi:arthrofactin-type cyclic lipopeptide synthetase C